MNCDAAFELLTRGPFPSGDRTADDALEQHLAACHDCRRLAEALRPAVGLFHEALADAETLSLPGYRGELQPADERGGPVQTLALPAQTAARSTAGRLTTGASPTVSIPPGRVRNRTRLMWPLAAACLLGAAIGLWGANTIGVDRAEPIAARDAQPAAGTTIQEVGPEDRLLLASFQLPAACGPAARSADGGRLWYECCTRCHAAAESALAPAVRLVTLTSSCVICHSDDSQASAQQSTPLWERDNRSLLDRSPAIGHSRPVIGGEAIANGQLITENCLADEWRQLAAAHRESGARSHQPMAMTALAACCAPASPAAPFSPFPSDHAQAWQRG